MSVTRRHSRNKFGNPAASVATMALSLLLLTGTGTGQAQSDIETHKKECKDNGYSHIVTKEEGAQLYYKRTSKTTVERYDYILKQYTCINGSSRGEKRNKSEGDKSYYYQIDEYMVPGGEGVRSSARSPYFYKHGDAEPV